MFGLNLGLSLARPPLIVPGAPAPAAYAAQAVRFDRTNDWLDREAGLTGAVDGVNALISFWFNMKGSDGSLQTFLHNSGGIVSVRRDAGNTITVFLANAALSILWQATTTATFLLAGGWLHFLMSADTTTDVSTRLVYINDVAETMVSETKNAGDIDYTRADFAVGAEAATGNNRVDADLADLYVGAEFLNLATEANRRKFIDAAGKPVDLGDDGSTPTGTKPLVYQSGATAAWHTNKGSGGGFTEVGALVDGASSPSD